MKRKLESRVNRIDCKRRKLSNLKGSEAYFYNILNLNIKYTFSLNCLLLQYKNLQKEYQTLSNRYDCLVRSSDNFQRNSLNFNNNISNIVF